MAKTAAQADAAATIIANAVDLPNHPAVVRCPANEVQPDSDLGARLVTRDVGFLTSSEIRSRLKRAMPRPANCLAVGLIEAAALTPERRNPRHRLAKQERKCASSVFACNGKYGPCVSSFGLIASAKRVSRP